MRDHNDNSGVFIRIPIEPREAWMPVHYGYEVQIDNQPEDSKEDEYHVTGTLYSLTKPLARPGKPGPEWNTMLITLDGPHTVVVVNDVKVTDYTEGQPVPARKFDFEPQHGIASQRRLHRPAKSQRQRHRLLQRSRRPTAAVMSDAASDTLRSDYSCRFDIETDFSSLRNFLFDFRHCCRFNQEPPMKNDLTRRQFLQRTAATAGAIATTNSILLHDERLERRPLSAVPPSDRLRFGIIGIGMQGSGVLANAIQLPGVECVAAADLYDGRHTLAREITGKPNLPATRRYQELLDNKDIDCIVAAVPDHWHKQVVVDSVSAGKDIYCEKPMSHTAADGVAMVAAAQRNRPHRANRLAARQLRHLRQSQRDSSPRAPSAN